MSDSECKTEREAANPDLADANARQRVLSLAGQRLAEQIDFLIEVDRLKNVLRRTLLTDGSRHENTAEHSWHLALLVMVLSEHSNVEIDPAHVMRLVLVHDIVEVDAGDTFCYDETGNQDKAEREQRAADRIFGLLPADQARQMHLLWREFEERSSPEARFANAVDRLQPMLHNFLTKGHSWRENGIVRAQVEDRNRPIADGSTKLWQFAERFLAVAEQEGWLGSPSDKTAP